MKSQRILVALLAAALLAAGCSRGGEEVEGANTTSSTASGDFGDLKNVCQGGKPSSSPAQGVTAGELEVGVFSDVGFTKNTEFVDAANVFTSWCNAAGGIGGRKLVATVRDAKLREVRQRMIEACREDFALVGGGAALDSLGTEDRLKCLLPDFPAQVVDVKNTGSDLQASGSGASASRPYNPYTGYHQWLITTYPASAGAVGIITGDSPSTKVMVPKFQESMTAMNASVVYNELYPATGVADWTPYAQSIKSKGVKGLLFLGDFRSLAKLEDVLTGMDYKLDWIDANSNAYNSQFLELGGKSLAGQNNFADLAGIAPVEAGATVPTVKLVKDLFAKYAPGKDVTYPVLRAFSAWLLFAKSAAGCGDQLTRKCVYDAATKETAWTAGGLQAPADVRPTGGALPKCYNIVQATPQGWQQPAEFKPDNGPYRCDMNAYVYKNDYGKGLTLADVGLSMNDFK
ncbi:ABC transporter substrate-binding protein [Nocardia sp. NPDC050630]|uniref:ABC transporter substrate-binding protein n=1 Tax=Nocardia sp. NPDC050630 TaxID=3364321 RepID=UPI0037A5C540